MLGREQARLLTGSARSAGILGKMGGSWKSQVTTPWLGGGSTAW
jgi:hypothetical protein